MFHSFIAYFDTMLEAISGIRRKDPGTQAIKNEKVIVLRTHDAVNADLAQLWCDEHGHLLQVADQRAPLFPPEACATVIDLDHLALTPSERAHLLQRLGHVLPSCPVAVASYNLELPILAALRNRGVLVFRRIERRLFYELATAINCDFADSAA